MRRLITAGSEDLLAHTMPPELSSITAFSALEDADLRLLREKAVTLAVPRGTVLIRQGDTAEALYFVIAGRFTVILEDREAVIAEIGPGESIGERAESQVTPEGDLFLAPACTRGMGLFDWHKGRAVAAAAELETVALLAENPDVRPALSGRVSSGAEPALHGPARVEPDRIRRPLLDRHFADWHQVIGCYTA